MSQPKIAILGTGTCQIQNHRMASSVLVELDALTFVYDFGRGVTLRLNELGLRQDDVQHIIISHFHPDHLADLIPFLHAASYSKTDPRQKDLHIYGPAGIEVQIMRILSLFGHNELTREFFKVHIHEIREESGFTLQDQQFSFIPLEHPNNHGLKFTYHGKTYAFTGDSKFDQKEIEFIKGVDLAVIDAGHISDEEIVALAVSSQAKTIVCSHLYRELDETELDKRTKEKGFQGKLIIGRDLMSFPL